MGIGPDQPPGRLQATRLEDRTRCRLGLLEKSNHGIDQDHGHDHAGVDPLLEQGGNQARGEQDMNQRLVKMRQKLQNRVPLPARGDLTGTDRFQAMFDVKSREPPSGIAVQSFDDLFGIETMPMSADQRFHRLLLRFIARG